MNLTQSVILNATGQAMFPIGGTSAYATHQFKGYTVSLEWDESDGEPMMLIWSNHAGRNAAAFGICLSSIGKYADPSGRPTDEGIATCAKTLAMLGKGQTTQELHNLVDTVLQFTPALIRMPSAPRTLRRKAMGEAYMDIAMQDRNGKTLNEVSL